jgi:subtilisin family serine protease
MGLETATPAPGRPAWEASTGRGVRIAVIDSGVSTAHPHVGGVAGGVAIGDDGREHEEAEAWVDRLGHGTAVIAAIKEKAPEAELYAVKVFDYTLSTRLDRLVRAVQWAARSGMHLVNLSLGTSKREHEAVLADVVHEAAARDVVIVAAHEADDVRWLPGSLPGVLAVQVDWSCPRDRFRVTERPGGGTLFRASGYPREIPGVPPERNLKGISFAVANMTGFAARALSAARDGVDHDRLTASMPAINRCTRSLEAMADAFVPAR